MEASREFSRTPPHLPPCSDVSVLQKTRMSHFWDTHHIFGPSQPRHTLVLERIPATSAPTVQTAKRCHVWLFGRLEPLVETL